MKITAFDELYPGFQAAYGTILGQSDGSNSAFGGDVVGDPGDLSVVGMRREVSLASNLTPVVTGDVLTIIASSPATARFATPSNAAGSNSLLKTTGGVGRVVTVAASGSAYAVMVGGANTWDITLTANCTLSLSGAAAAGFESSILFILRQDASGNRTVTWPAAVTWAVGSPPTLSTAGNAIDFVLLETVDGGTTWYGFPIGGGTASPLTTKGDLYTYTTTNARIAVGSNGQFIVSDPLTTTGLRWTNNPAVGELLLSSTASVPPVFGDILTTSSQDDFVYGSR